MTTEFSISQYGLLGATRVAEEICKRGAYFFKKWLGSEGNHVYTEADVQDYPGSAAWQDFIMATAEPSLFERALAMERLAPRLGAF